MIGLTFKIDFRDFAEVFQKEIKNAVDGIVKKFYDKEFRAGIGGTVGDTIVFWYPRLWRNISAGKLSTTFYSQLHSKWNKAVKDRVFNFKRYGIPSLSFVGFLLRVYRRKTTFYRQIREKVGKRSEESAMQYYKRVYKSSKWIPLYYTGKMLEEYTSHVKIDTKGVFKYKDMSGKKSYRLELYPPEIIFELPNTLKYDTKYSNAAVGVFHYTGAKGFIRVQSRRWLPLGEIALRRYKGIRILPKEDTVFKNEVLKPCLSNWVKEVLKMAAKQGKESGKRGQPQKDFSEMEKRIRDLLKRVLDLSEKAATHFAKLISRATEAQLRKIFEYLDEISPLSVEPAAIIKLILKIKEEYE